MTPPQLASKLVVWSKRKIDYTTALQYANNYLCGVLGEGVVKEYFKTLYVIESPCRIPTCTNLAKDHYCEACTNMIPSSAVSGLLKALGEFLCGRP